MASSPKSTQIKASDSAHLVWELSDALHQVLVAVPVPGYHLAQGRDQLEGVGVIENVQARHSHLGGNIVRL